MEGEVELRVCGGGGGAVGDQGWRRTGGKEAEMGTMVEAGGQRMVDGKVEERKKLTNGLEWQSLT